MTAPAAPPWRLSRRRPRGHRHSGPHRHRPGTAIALAALVGALGLPRLAAASNAGGGTARLRARAAALATTLVADGARIQAAGGKYLAAQSAHRAALADAAADHVRIAGVDRRLGHDRTTLQHAAIAAYVAAGSESPLGLFLAGRPGTLAVSQTYLAALTGQLTTAAATLTDDRVALQRALSAAKAAEQKAVAALRRAATARANALATYRSEQHLLATTRGQLARLVAAEAAARARAAALAAARRRAAELAAARAAAAKAAAERAAAAKAAAAETTTTQPDARPRAAPAAAPGLTAPPDAGAPAPASGAPAVTTSAIPAGLQSAFAGIRRCESGDVYSLDTGNGYYGAYQFSLQTWLDLGDTGLPSAAPPVTQDAAAYRLYSSSGWASWPACAAILGL